MHKREIKQSIVALLILTLVISFQELIRAHWSYMLTALSFAFLILAANIGAKKWAAKVLDAHVEHELWQVSRFGLKPGRHTPKPIPAGAIIPLVISVFTLGITKCMTLLTYTTSARKQRAARRFGYYSFTEMTDWHNALVGSAGIVGVLALAVVSYSIPALTGLPSLAIYYAFWNLVPWSKLDGAQIVMGSRVVYTALALITVVMTLATFVIA